MGSLPFCHCSFQGKIAKRGFPVELKTVGDAIRKRRMELGIRQADVAELIGCDIMSVVNWEKNHTTPRISHMAKIVEFLGCIPPMECATLAQRLVGHRTGLGITQKDFAKKIGIDPTTLARWERGEREPTGRFLRLVMTAMSENLLPDFTAEAQPRS